MSSDLGKWLIFLGVILAVVGLIIWLFGNRLGWMGHLPGDIRIENDNVHFYFPITTMIIVSIVLSLLFTILSRLFGK